MRYAKRLLAVLLTGLVLSGCGGKTKEEQALTETAAGDWELVSMSYSGMTLGKEDLDSSDITMTLSLLEDGTGTMEYAGSIYELTWDGSSITTDGVADSYTLEDGVLTIADEDTEMVFTRPGSLASPDAPKAEQETLAAGAASEQSVEESWTVEPLASAQDLVPYSCTEFSMNIPEGWTVRSSAMYTGMFHAIHVLYAENGANVSG